MSRGHNIMSELIIPPKTKILHLIENYPQLEDILIQYAPAFKKLKNPLLRKTVAKIATIQQAASVGNVNVEELINRLRKEVGQDLFLVTSTTEYIIHKPDWYSAEKVELEFNAKEMLDAGEHPVNQVMADLKNMNNDKIYKLVAPFIPAPLIDKASGLKIQHWIEKVNEDQFNVYFFKG
jgi:hypothetical protein